MNKYLLLCIIFSFTTQASQRKNVFSDIKGSYTALSKDSKKLLKLFYFSRDREYLKAEVLKRGALAAPVLTSVMKDARFNERNRWSATFLLGRVVGKKSGTFIRKFIKHPNWILRLASLKTLTALGDKKTSIYKSLLSDPSLIVRMQTLDSIEKLKLKALSASILQMMFKSQNYQKVGKRFKRSPIISKAITVLGKLKHKKSLKVFSKLIKKKDYKDIHPELKKAITAMN